MMIVQNGAAKESSCRGDKNRVQKTSCLRVPSPMPLLETRVGSPMPPYTRTKEPNLPPPSHVVKQAQQFLEANVKAWMQPNCQEVTMAVDCPLAPITSVGISHHALLEHNQSYGGFTQGVHPPPSFYPLYPIPPSPYTSPYYLPYGQSPNAHQASAAASFFARAAQKLNLSSRKKRRHHLPPDPEPPPFLTNFNAVLQESPPPAPPALLRSVGRKDSAGHGKVKVMLRITPTSKDGDSSSSFLSLDARKKQVTVFDPSVCGFVTPEDRRAGVAAPKMFAFDAVFSQDDSQTEVCSTALTDVVQAVVNGNDGCLFCYGHNKLGKTYTMIGDSGSIQTIGAIPCAISWLFKLINEQKQKTGARFSVRVSAVEISGKNEALKDLLSEQANGTENSGTSPGIYLREDPIFGAQLQNQSELRVPTVEKAGYYLDAALTARTNDTEDEGRNSHMLFTLHVYQYRVDKSGKGGVAGGRSRLHLLDLGSCDKQGKGSSLTLSGLANVILAILYGQKHVPFKDSKLTQLLREILGSLSCNAAMIAHVSPSMANYSETLSTIQFAARIHRLRRKKLKHSSQSSGESSCDDIRVRKHLAREDGIRSGSSDPDHTSSSEQSCDTVIYVGPNGTALSDRELTDNESPPVALPVTPKHIPKSSTFKAKPHPTSFNGGTPLKEVMKNSDIPADNSTSVMNGKDSLDSDNNKKENKARESSCNRDQGKSNSVSTNTKCGKNNSRRSSSNKSKHSGVQGNVEKHSSSPSRMILRTYSPIAASQSQGNSVEPKSALWNMEEQWIDGPKVRKTWFEAQSALHRQEMWVDGPPAMYGYMDKHKREMIQRWLDFQSSHVQRLANEENEVWIDGRNESSHLKKDKLERKDTDLHHGTNLNCNSVKPSGVDTTEATHQDAASAFSNEDRNVQSFINFPEHIQIKDEKFNYFSNGFMNSLEANISKNLPLPSDSAKQKEEAELKTSQPLLQTEDYSETQENNNVIDCEDEPLLDSEQEEDAGSDPEADMMYNNTVDSHNLDPLLEESEEDLSPEEPIMQDSCLQVTEEDILAACMEFNEDHPLRILSEENLASSFADTFSVDTDLRTPSFQESESEVEDDDHLDDIPPCAKIKLEAMSHYSLPVYAMHFSFPKIVNQWTEIGEEENSICSEPAPYGYKQIQPRTLKSTHTNITTVYQNPASGKWNIQETIQVTSSLESKYIKTDEVSDSANSTPLRTNQYKDLEELSCLRHPDGASNPNLHDELLLVNTDLPKLSKERRSPGNGASNSDAEDKNCYKCSCTQAKNQDTSLPDKCQCMTECQAANEPECNSPKPSQLSRLFGKKTCCSDEKNHSSGCKLLHQNALPVCDNNNHKLNYSPKSSPKTNSRFSSRIPVSVKSSKENSSNNNKTPTNLIKDAHKCNKSPLSSMCLCSRPTSPQSIRRKDDKDNSKTHCKKFCQGTKIPCSDKKHSKRKTKNDLSQSPCLKQGHKRFVGDLSSENSRGSPASDKLGKKGTPVSQHASGTSSGYESMLRDSEGSGTSSDQESASEASDGEEKSTDKHKGNILNKADDRNEETTSASKIWNLNDIFELKEYDEEDVERIEKRRMMEETFEIRKHRQRVLHLRMRQEELRKELSAAKNRLMLEPNRWSYDLHVEESMDIDDPSFLEVLERETQILEKRVVACKSHIMMVTCFDANL